MDVKAQALQAHRAWQGKIEIVPRMKIETAQDLSLAYTPGVAEPCLAIRDNPDESYALTRRWNLVAVVTDGTAVLGLGDIGPEAGMPVMEGKCCLFKAFANVDAFRFASAPRMWTKSSIRFRCLRAALAASTWRTSPHRAAVKSSASSKRRWISPSFTTTSTARPSLPRPH